MENLGNQVFSGHLVDQGEISLEVSTNEVAEVFKGENFRILVDN